MRPIQNWENVKAFREQENLPAGGYVCEIKSAKEVQNRSGSGSHLEIMLEVCEGEYAGFFERDYRGQMREDKFWRGVIRQNIPDEASDKYEMQCSFFKAFTAAVEDSNAGYHWDWDEVKLKGRKVGVIFGEREALSQRGNVYMRTEAQKVVSAELIRKGDYKVPEPKLLVSQSDNFNAGGLSELGSAEDLPF